MSYYDRDRVPMTSKPCPGCGREGEERYGSSRRHSIRPKGKVCSKCQEKLDRYDELSERAAVQEGECGITVSKSHPFGHVVASLGSHFLGAPHRVEDRLEAAVAHLISTLGRVPEGADPKGDYEAKHGFQNLEPEYDPSRRAGLYHHRIVSTETANALREMLSALRDFGSGCLDAGVEHGQSILHQLAAGSMSMDALNKATIQKDRS